MADHKNGDNPDHRLVDFSLPVGVHRTKTGSLSCVDSHAIRVFAENLERIHPKMVIFPVADDQRVRVAIHMGR